MKGCTETDAFVVGLGPAGSTCAWLLAIMGLSVIGIDRSGFPRIKPCGGCISDRLRKMMGPAVEDAVEREYYGSVLVYRDGEELAFRSDSPVAYGIGREVLDSLLLGRARRAGVEVNLGERFLTAVVEENFIEVRTNERSYRVRYLVGADGAGGTVSRMVRGEAPAMIAYDVRIDGWPFDSPRDMLRIYFGSVPGGYGWAFPKNGYTSLGIVTSTVKGAKTRDLLDGFLRETIGLDRTGSVEVRGGLIPLHRKGKLHRLSLKRIVLVGDSGGFVDPFLAEGISYAVQSAMLAAPIIVSACERGDGDLSLYDTAARDVFYTAFDSAGTLARYVYTFPRLSFLVMKKKKEIAGDLFQLIRGNTVYQEFIGRFKASIGSIL